MKNIHIVMILLFGTLYLSSCDKDNYDAPDASLSGSIIDESTGELVESDIINGTIIELIEHGYETPNPYQLIVKVDGTYMNSMLFSNTYSIPPINVGNFVPQPDTVVVDIQGSFIYDFHVQPYIRVKEASITNNGMVVTARFKLEQTVSNNVKRIGLYGHREPSVGEPMRTSQTEVDLNRQVSSNEEFVLTLDVSLDSDYEVGKSYHFRIGALINAPQAKFNYSKAERLTLNN